MGFIEAVKTCFSKYATFKGRAMRSEFWYFMLFGMLIQFVLMVFLMSSIDFNALASDNPEDHFAGVSAIYGSTIGILLLVVGLALILPSIAVGARRLHDSGRTGWWQLLYFVTAIPLIGLVALLALIYFWVQKSQPEENKYGPTPM